MIKRLNLLSSGANGLRPLDISLHIPLHEVPLVKLGPDVHHELLHDCETLIDPANPVAKRGDRNRALDFRGVNKYLVVIKALVYGMKMLLVDGYALGSDLHPVEVRGHSIDLLLEGLQYACSVLGDVADGLGVDVDLAQRAAHIDHRAAEACEGAKQAQNQRPKAVDPIEAAVAIAPVDTVSHLFMPRAPAFRR